MGDYFMCPPSYFTVRYRINPWMRPDEPVATARAVDQWRRLRDVLETRGHRVRLIGPQRALPDMVFAANGGIVIGDRALVPRFRHAERAAESAHFAAAFTAAGLAEVHQARCRNEGEGDFRVIGDRILAGVGLRSEPAAIGEVADFFGLPTVGLTLVDPRFYHLDTALAVLDDQTVAYWPPAFDAASRRVLAELFPDGILAGDDDAASLALNMVSDGATVIMQPGRAELAARIRDRGFDVVELVTDELRKAGGGAKCCVLEWHRPGSARSLVPAAEASSRAPSSLAAGARPR